MQPIHFQVLTTAIPWVDRPPRLPRVIGPQPRTYIIINSLTQYVEGQPEKKIKISEKDYHNIKLYPIELKSPQFES